MKTLRLFAICMVAVAAAGLGSLGCSCKSSTVGKDLLLVWEPSTIDFGEVAIGDAQWQDLELTHRGSTGTIEFLNIRLQGLNTEEFQFDPPEKTFLEPGESVTIRVHYSPRDSTNDAGMLVIEHNVGQQGNVTNVQITALGQLADLRAIPNPIDFGDITVGSHFDMDVILKNSGSDVVVVTEIYPRLDGSIDFSLEGYVSANENQLPVTLNPGEEMGVVIRYAPMGGGCDESALIVAGETKGAVNYWPFTMYGCELGPRIVVSPGQVDFGWVEINKTEQRLLMISNQGNADLVIPKDGISVFPGSIDKNIGITEFPSDQVVTVPPAGDVTFKVTWDALEPRADDGNPIGQVLIASNDLSQSPTMIPVFGLVEAPLLEVIPTQVDMGYGAQNIPVQRTVTLRNDGYGMLKVYSMEIVDVSTTQYGEELWIENNAAFPVTVDGTTESQVAGYSAQPVVLKFKNLGPEEGQLNATLRITTNAKGKETVNVPIVASRTKSARCLLGFRPSGANFGTVAIGFPETREIFLVNAGNAPCIIQAVKVADCQGGMFGGSTCPEPLGGSNSSVFRLSGVPPIGTQLEPGQDAKMTLSFTPPSSTPLFGILNQYTALMSAKGKDALSNLDVLAPNCPKDSMGAVTCQANVLGSSGIAKASVLPAEIDFGVTTIGCCSRTYSVCVYNSGNAPLKVTDVQLKGCTPEFKLVGLPKLPKSVLGGAAPVCFSAVYRPQDLGDDKCVMQLSVTDKSSPVAVIPLRGTGTYEDEQTDKFTQVKGDEVDILFVIDDSGSMCEEQTRMNQSFSEFISSASVWQNDFNIGVISLNVTDEAVIGRLNRGNASITPRYLTKANYPTSSFAKLAYLGCSGGSDSQEAGLQAAQTALAAPLTTDTRVACTRDSDCKADPNICPDAATCPYLCADGTCGGWNKGFVRDDARLEMLMLSDEEDQSSGSIPFYIDFFKNLKGWHNQGRMHVNAIVGVSGVPSGTGSGCTSTDGGTADAGRRYIEVVDQTGGLYDSICKSSFAPIMKSIGEAVFVPKTQFFLSRIADPSTITVKVNGTQCTKGWRYDAPSNSIIFDLDGACMPEAQDKIEVHYKTLCLKC
jgi:hypothetical protein